MLHRLTYGFRHVSVNSWSVCRRTLWCTGFTWANEASHWALEEPVSFQLQDCDPEITHSARNWVSCWTLSWKGPGDTWASSSWGCSWGGHMHPVGFSDLDLKSAWQWHCRTLQFQGLLRGNSTVGHYLPALEERKALPTERMVSA